MQEINIAVGTTPDKTDILPWTTLNDTSDPQSVGVVIPDGVDGWVKIQAIDNGEYTTDVPVHVHDHDHCFSS